MRHGGLKNVEGKFPNLEISEEKILSKKNSNFRNQRRKKKYEEYLRNIEEKILILDVSEEIFFFEG